MHYYEVAPNQIFRGGADSFTYGHDVALPLGTIVEVEIGKKSAVGVVIRAVKKPEFATKPLLRVIEATPLPAALLQTALWMASYYATPLATVLQTILPRGLTKTRRSKAVAPHKTVRKRTKIVFTPDQQKALDTMAGRTGTMLLHGVTGSGKTAVYIEQAKRAMAAGQSVIVLVPEIALTSQLVDEFTQHFSDVLLAHSRQTEAERHLAWREALTSTTPRLVVGARSALFMPVPNLGLVIIDECHEPSFHQEQSPRYSALRVASHLVGGTRGLCLLGSATPLAEDYYLAKQANAIIAMPRRAKANTVKPITKLVDMTKRTHFRRHRFLSDDLLHQLDDTFAEGKQALIFHNRRGSASTTLCENCGWQAGCPRCYVPLTLHTDSHNLRCHICGLTTPVPTSCPECHHADIIHKGIGTKMIETELKKLYPAKTIQRFDGDTAPGQTVEALYDKLYHGHIDLIIGTQVIAKGLDLPHLRTVGIVQADSGLSLPDYSSPERTFQLLSQVVGRVGRAEHKTTVVIQSYQPDHPVVTAGIAQDYAGFYERTLALRRRTIFPPYCYLLKLTVVYKTEAAAVKNAQALARDLRPRLNANAELLGPTPAFYERQGGTFRWQLVVKSPRRQDLLNILHHLPTKNWRAELDPLSLL